MGGFLLHYNGEYEYPYLGIRKFHEVSPPFCPTVDSSMSPSRVIQTKIQRAGYEKLRIIHEFIVKEEIQDKSKSDGLAKLVVLVQTAWFTGQCLARAIQKLAITELEVVALAYTALNGVMYFFWWHKPLDVQFPVVIDVHLPPEPEGSVVEGAVLQPPDDVLTLHGTRAEGGTYEISLGPDGESRFNQEVLAVRQRPGRFPRVEKAWSGCILVCRQCRSFLQTASFDQWWRAGKSYC